jgi:hypothetical protein
VSRDKVMVAVVHGGTYETDTAAAMSAMTAFDLRAGGKYLNHDKYLIHHRGTDIAAQRNTLAAQFLETDVDWLLYLDTDEVWNPDLIDRLMDSADKDERPIISGLVMAYRPERELTVAPACGVFADSETLRIVAPSFIPNVRWWQVATVGAGCLLIHRTVLERMRDEYGDKYPTAVWFDQAPFVNHDQDGNPVPDRMGEDYVFSARATACGFPLYVDTTVELGHIKRVTFTRDQFHAQRAAAGYRPTFVIVPVKDKLELTQNLIAQLREQGGWDGLFVYDNGSGHATKQWLNDQRDLMVWDAKGAGIHDMWNAGANQALRRSGGVCDLVFLNNDLVLGDRFCGGLVDALASGPWAAVSANYDKRTADEQVVQVHGICAERYDGTGGLAGFAFAVKGEFFAAGYRFPTDAKWWYGDNDLVMTMDVHGYPYGIATYVAVEHLGAGTAGDWADKKWAAQLAADRAAFARKWEPYGVKVA